MKNRGEYHEEVVAELPDVEGFKARLVRNPKGELKLDVREYLGEGESRTGYVGFTKKGLRLSSLTGAQELIVAAQTYITALKEGGQG